MVQAADTDLVSMKDRAPNSCCERVIGAFSGPQIINFIYF